jgi:putative DNA primase/helicase
MPDLYRTPRKKPQPENLESLDLFCATAPQSEAPRPSREAGASVAAPGPDYVSFGSYTMDRKGLTRAKKIEGPKDKTESVWIAGRFEILGACRDPHGRAWGKLLRWRDADGREHTRHVSEAALQGDPAGLCASLADEGLPIARDRQRDLASYVSMARVDKRVTVVSRTGWHTIGERDVFVLPGETIGPCGAETVILDGAATGPYEARGTLSDWQAGVGALASGHALPVLAISAAFAGPLLYLAGQEGGGLNFFGPSSMGKTTLLQLAASVWGRGGSPGYVRAWRATANGLEGAAAGASDTALVLDELGVVEARDAATSIYGIANGAGKARAARNGDLREPKCWRVMTLSSGEVPIAAKLAEDRGRMARAGQFVRLLDVQADRGAGCGAFDDGGPDGDAAALSKSFKAAAQTHYGTAGPEFVRRLIAEGVTGDDIRAMVGAFVAATAPPGSDGQVDRAAQRFGLIAAAGHLATISGVTPWREGEATEAARWAFETWLAGRGGREPAEVRQALEQVRLVIEQYGDSRFEAVDGEGDARPVNRLGWRRGSGAEREWWIPPEVWRAEICAGLDPTFVAKTLAERDLMRTQGGRGFQCKVNLGGDRRAWAYVLTANIMDGGADAA